MSCYSLRQLITQVSNTKYLYMVIPTSNVSRLEIELQKEDFSKTQEKKNLRSLIRSIPKAQQKNRGPDYT